MEFEGYIPFNKHMAMNWDSPGINVVTGLVGTGKTSLFKILMNALFHQHLTLASSKYWLTLRFKILKENGKSVKYRIGKGNKGSAKNNPSRPSWIEPIYTFQRRKKGEWVDLKDTSHRVDDVLKSISKVIGIDKNDSHLLFLKDPHAKFLMSPALTERFINNISGIDAIQFLLDYIKKEHKPLKSQLFELNELKTERKYVKKSIKGMDEDEVKKDLRKAKGMIVKWGRRDKYVEAKKKWDEYEEFLKILKKHDVSSLNELQDMIDQWLEYNTYRKELIKYKGYKSSRPKKKKPSTSKKALDKMLEILDEKDDLTFEIEELDKKLKGTEVGKLNRTKLTKELVDSEHCLKLTKKSSKKGQCPTCGAELKLKDSSFYKRKIEDLECDLELLDFKDQRNRLQGELERTKVDLTKKSIKSKLAEVKEWEKWECKKVDKPTKVKKPKVDYDDLKSLMEESVKKPVKKLTKEEPPEPNKSLKLVNREIGALKEKQDNLKDFKEQIEEYDESIKELVPFVLRSEALTFFQGFLETKKESLEDSKNLLNKIVKSANSILKTFLPDKTLHNKGFGLYVDKAPLDEASNGEKSLSSLSMLTTLLLISGFKCNALLIDEPTLGMNPIDMRRLKPLFLELNKSRDSLFLTSHEPILISQADHVTKIEEL